MTRRVDEIWFASYPPGVPRSIDPDQHASLVALLDDACSEFADHAAFENHGATLTYAALDRHATAFARYLVDVCGLRRGDRVALMMPNMLAYPVTLLGVLRAGGVVVNVNPLYTAHELTHQLTDAGARVLVAWDGVRDTVATAHAALPVERLLEVGLGDFMPRLKGLVVDFVARRRSGRRATTVPGTVALRAALRSGAKSTTALPTLDLDDLAFLQYTGGTTGRAKGAMLTHRNIVANVLQVTAWLAAETVRGAEVMITALPLYHVYALTSNCLSTMVVGGLNCLITDPRDLDTFVRTLARVPFTSMTGVNTLFAALLEHPDFAQLDFSRLKFTSGGGMAVQRVVAERWQAVTGSVLAEGYGLTEASPVVTINRFDVETFTGSIGLPVPSTAIRIKATPEVDAAIGEPGELCVRGPQVMRGYWENPEETAAVLDADGWLHTGDIARIEADGYLYLVDRKKDVILVSGFNVYPNEIEDVVAAHPDVREVAAIGVADERSGEAVRLIVVPAVADLEAATLLAWCRERLTGYKMPRSVVFAQALPKTPVGKILRRALRERYGEEP
ncbi:MAG: AMP-binding protein [Gammaproteobacteria bacterium]